MVCDMDRIQGIIFIISTAAMTVYLCMTAVEDHRTCMVTRWKHLIGFIPAVLLETAMLQSRSKADTALTAVLTLIFLSAGMIGAYGLADGFVMANLTLYFGAVSGSFGAFLSWIVFLLAGVLFTLHKIVRAGFCVRRMTENGMGAFIPYIAAAYGSVLLMICLA